jgi:hypothetical protein
MPTSRVALRAEIDSIGKVFVTEGKLVLKKYWLLLIYMVLLMAGFNFMARLLPTLFFRTDCPLLTYNLPQ